MTSEPNKNITYLKAFRCEVGEDCIDWLPPHCCDYEGITVVGGARKKCLCFRQNHEYQRRKLHEKIEKGMAPVG